MPGARLTISRRQILAFRRRVGRLDRRQRRGPGALRTAAWAGLQDSMPRAALLSIHARMSGTQPSTWEDRSLVQLWGPRYSAYVVDARDVPVFTLGRRPERGQTSRAADDLAERLRAQLGSGAMSYGDAGKALGVPPNRLRYAALTGTVLLRWDGARLPTIRLAPPPVMEQADARRELARRYLHVFGPATPEAFATWAGVPSQQAASTFDALRRSLTAVRTPIGEAWVLAKDVEVLVSTPPPPAPARLLPSGDAYYLLHGRDRDLLVPDERRRGALWTSRVWPGAVLVRGEIVGTWRRAEAVVTIHPWKRLSRPVREAVEAEAIALPLPGMRDAVSLRWEG